MSRYCGFTESLATYLFRFCLRPIIPYNVPVQGVMRNCFRIINSSAASPLKRSMYKRPPPFILVYFIFVVTSCNGTQAVVTPPALIPTTSSIAISETLTPLPTFTSTSILTKAPTQTATSSPTLQPPATPNFNAPAITRTPSSRAVCPNIDAEAKISFDTDFSDIEATLLRFLKSGGTPTSLQRTFEGEEASRSQIIWGKPRPLI